MKINESQSVEVIEVVKNTIVRIRKEQKNRIRKREIVNFASNETKRNRVGYLITLVYKLLLR